MALISAANHLDIWKQYEVGIVHFAAGYLSNRDKASIIHDHGPFPVGLPRL